MQNTGGDILILAITAILPMVAVFLLPNKINYFQKPAVRGFALGVYTALVVLLIHETLEHAGLVVGLMWFLVGLFISLLIGIFFKEFHHHHSEEEKIHNHTKASISRILTSDFFHNIVDGVAILSGFSISTIAGVTSFVGVLLHQVIQQGGQQILLVDSGIKPKNAFFLSFFVSLSIMFAIVIKNGKSFESILIAISAGIIAWKVITDINHTKWNLRTIVGFVFGALLLSLTLILIPHE